jgi:hypothetical protein
MTEELKVAILKYIDRWGLGKDHRFYDPKEWQGRGEEMGQYADLTLTCEGTLNHVLNGYRTDSRHLIDDFNRTVNGTGYWYEWGHAWSIHFYKMEKK